MTTDKVIKAQPRVWMEAQREKIETAQAVVLPKYPEAQVEISDYDQQVYIVSEKFGRRISAGFKGDEEAQASAWANAAARIVETAKREKHFAEVRRADLAISHKVVRTLLAAGFEISIDNGGGEEREITNSTDGKAIFKAMHLTDEDYIMPTKSGHRHGWVRLIYGESGWDVICDYTTNLEQFIGEGSAVEKTVEYWEKRICR